MHLKTMITGSVLFLAACANQYEQCVRNSAKDLRVVNDLISQSHTTLSRGYGFETRIATEIEEVVCLTSLGEQATCLVEVGSTYQTPVAVDLDAERRKLAQLVSQRKVLEARLTESEQVCRATYPPEA